MNNIIDWYNILLRTMLILSPVIFFILLFVSAPYGRHARSKWGPLISSRAGWVIMELPAVLVILICLLFSNRQPVTYVFLIMWEVHYIHRALIFPFQSKNSTKPMPISIVVFAFIFNLINGFINGISLSVIHTYDVTWLTDPRFIVGTGVFLLGFSINRRADWVLQHLRRPGETSYKIPQGGLYNFISCPNYLGEMIQWLGWAIATWSFAGLAFFIWTTANLLPRALKHNQWYRDTFPEYPQNRRALIPWVL